MAVRKRYGVPGTDTPGNVGDLYVDLNTDKVYRCVDVVTYGDSSTDCTVYVNRGEKNTVYIWKSTGASSWNDLEDKPFYEAEEIVNEPLNITWDGNTEGLVQIPEMSFFKVSDIVLTDEQIKSITFTMSDGSSLSLAGAWDSAVDMGMVTEDVVNAPVAVFARKNNSVMEGTSTVIPEAGIYLAKYSDEGYVASLTTTEPVEQTKTVIHPIDPKFLPDGYPYEEVVATPVTAFEFELEATDTDNPYKWFGHGDLPFELDGLLAVLNSENVGKTVCVNYDGVQYMCDVHMDNHFSWYIGNTGLMKNFDRRFDDNDADSVLERMKDDGLIIDTGEPFLFLSHSYYTVYNYIVASDTNPHNVEVGFCDTVVHKLDKKFLPDDIGGSGGGAEIIEATVNTSRTDILDLPITTREIFDKVKSGVDVVIKTTFTKSSEPFTAFFRLTSITNDGVYLIAQLPWLTASGVKEDRCILYIYAGQAMTTAEYRFAT